MRNDIYNYNFPAFFEHQQLPQYLQHRYTGTKGSFEEKQTYGLAKSKSILTRWYSFMHFLTHFSLQQEVSNDDFQQRHIDAMQILLDNFHAILPAYIESLLSVFDRTPTTIKISLLEISVILQWYIVNKRACSTLAMDHISYHMMNVSGAINDQVSLQS